MRKALMLAAFAMSIFASGSASALIVTNGETVTVSGPFTSDPFGPIAILTATLVVNATISPEGFFQVAQYGWNAGASIDGAGLMACASNNPGPCGEGDPSEVTLIFSSPATFTVSTSFAPFIVDPLHALPPGFTISGTTSVDLEVIGEGDAFSIAEAVPEPSTWAMLMIGFAGIGFAGYRKRRHWINPTASSP
jgi:hypothetical protein